MYISASREYKLGEIGFGQFYTRSPRMLECLRLAQKAAQTDLTVLITGETGTGKNLIAQAIHNGSPRQTEPCVVVNSTAISETLIESELFGHEKGAFTGAQSQRKGRFELAHGGTLVLDEIGDMSASAQARILRAVEYRQFERLGGQETIQVDTRIVAATNRDLTALVASGAFRQDLLYRLAEIHLVIPPLRERREDLPFLADLFAREASVKLGGAAAKLAPAALELLARHSWPGNLRELKVVIRRAAMLAENGEIRAEDLGLTPAPLPAAPAEPADAPAELTLAAAEKRQIRRVLALTHGNKRKASQLLDIARNTLDKKIAEYGLELPSADHGD